MSKHTHVDRARRYVDGVLGGKVPACRLVRLACERAKRDREASKAASYPYRFDPAKAERVCKFLELFGHSKGKWAAQREPFILEDFQCFMTCEIFGWVRKRDKLRRFRKALIMMPRKNGKSDWAARVGLYMFAADGEHGAECYSGATSERQSWEVFRPALAMAKATPDFQKHFGVQCYKQSLSIAATGSRFEPLIGRPGDGASPSFAVADEYHEHATDDLAQTMLTGMGSREAPLMLYVSTAGSNTAGPCYALQMEAQRMLDGVAADDELFALIFGIDQDDDWTDPAMLPKANPNYGVSVSADFLQSRLRDAMANAREQGVFQTKHLNRWVGARSAYFDLPKWIECARQIELKDFVGRRVKLGIDLASTVDVNAVNLLFRDGDRYSTFSRFYLPEATVDLGTNQHYQTWQREGRLIVTEGEIVDMSRIRDDILDLARQFVIEEIAFDPFQATMLVTELTKAGLTCVEVRPIVLNFSAPMKFLDGLIRAGRIEHDGCPIMQWMIGNVTALEDSKDNVFPRKEQRENKIDGVVALLSALARDMVAQPKGESIFNILGRMTEAERAEISPALATVPATAARSVYETPSISQPSRFDLWLEENDV
jgi:phage terminase large subunit-like protein